MSRAESFAPPCFIGETALTISRSLMNIDDTVHFTLREWTRMSLAPTLAEVERAKSQLKASLLLGLDGTTAIAEDVRSILPFLYALAFDLSR